MSRPHRLLESFIAGLVDDKVISPFCYQGTCDTNLFNLWLGFCLLSALGPGYVIIMDNAAFHKSEQTQKIIADA